MAKDSKLDKVEKQLKAQEKEMQNTKQALARAEDTIAMLEDWLRKLLKPCPGCGIFLQLVDWNSSVYMLTCDHSNCSRWRQPVGSIKKEDLTNIIGVLKFKEG